MARGDLLSLIRSGALPVGSTLFHRSRGDHSRDATATVVADGLRMGGRVHPTASGAARAITHKPVDGWLFWKLPSGEPLAFLRPAPGERHS